jgi:hypothetical protein
MTPLQASRSLRDLVKVPAQIAPAVAKRIKKDIERYFSAGTDPYGKAWAPLKPSTRAKGRHPPPLTDTRGGRRGIKVAPMRGSGIKITSDTPYMVYHMREATHRAARKFLPEGVVPANWFKIWQQELDKIIRAKYG